jgi:hypothetical protein
MFEQVRQCSEDSDELKGGDKICIQNFDVKTFSTTVTSRKEEVEAGK